MPVEANPDLVLGEKYRLVRRLGGGVSGSIWEAVHLGLDAKVAIKILAPFVEETARQRFEREAKIGARLHSPHLVRVQDFGEQDGTPFMVLELLEGEDLNTRQKRLGRLPPGDVLPIARQIALGLSVLHREGVVHRDLKPANVFLAREGAEEVAKIVDFGIAREEAAGVARLTAEGTAIGSPTYMSPEQALGRPVDARSDLWSFGVLLFKLLTGERPFDGPDLGSVMVAIAKSPHRRATGLLPTLPGGLDVFFARALKKDAVDRFASAEEMIAAFEKALATEAHPPAAEPAEVAAEPAPAPAAAARAAVGPRREHLIGAGVVAAILLGGALYLRRAPAPVAPPDRAATPGVASALPKRVPGVELPGADHTLRLPLDRPFVMNVWLERCADCMPAFDAWRDLAKSHVLPDVPIVNVSAYHAPEVSWAERYFVDQNLVVDKGNLIVRPLQISSFTTFVVSKDGTILFRGRPEPSGKFTSDLLAALEAAERAEGE